MYENFTKAHSEAADQHVPVQKRNKKKNVWKSLNVIEKGQNLHNALDENQKNPDLANKGEVEKAKHELDEAYHTEQESYVKEKILKIENAHLNRKACLAWETVNEISGRKNTKKGQIRADSPEERIEL